MFFPPPVKYRSSLSEVFCKKGVLKNFAKLTGKLLCRGLILRTFFYRTAPVAASDHVANSSKVPLNLDLDDFFEN